MEEEGIYYYFEHDNGEHKLILCDTYSSHKIIPAYTEIPYYPPDATTIRHEDIINHWSEKYKVALEKVDGKNTYYILGHK